MAVPRAEQLPSGRWRGIATVEGRRTYETFDRQGQALAWADTTMRRALAEQRRPPVQAAPEQVTVGAFVGVFLATRALEESTITTYRSNLKAATERWKDWSLDAVTYEDVAAWMASMTRQRGSERRSPRTWGARLKVLRAMYGEAIRMGKATHDPTADIRIPSLPESPFRLIAPEEETALLTAAETNGLYAQTVLALDAGMRWGEVFGLRRHRINPLNQRITIADVLSRPNFTLREYPKGKKYRTLWMTDRLAEALDTHMTGKRIAPDGLLFTSGTGTTVNYHNFRHVWDRTIKQAALDNPLPTFHDLRHSFGSRMAEAGTPSKEIATLLGHADTKTTDLYIHAAGPQVSQAWMRHALQDGPNPITGGVRRRA